MRFDFFRLIPLTRQVVSSLLKMLIPYQVKVTLTSKKEPFVFGRKKRSENCY